MGSSMFAAEIYRFGTVGDLSQSLDQECGIAADCRIRLRFRVIHYLHLSRTSGCYSHFRSILSKDQHGKCSLWRLQRSATQVQMPHLRTAIVRPCQSFSFTRVY
jgi:hypothetical protein